MIILNKKRNTGFMALMSAIIISVVLFLIATNLSLTGFYSRSNILDSELKERSSAFAEACVDKAILKIISEPDYIPNNEIISVGSDTCKIQSVAGGSQKTILVQSNYNNKYFTNLEVLVGSDMSIISWQEI